MSVCSSETAASIRITGLAPRSWLPGLNTVVGVGPGEKGGVRHVRPRVLVKAISRFEHLARHVEDELLLLLVDG